MLDAHGSAHGEGQFGHGRVGGATRGVRTSILNSEVKPTTNYVLRATRAGAILNTNAHNPGTSFTCESIGRGTHYQRPRSQRIGVTGGPRGRATQYHSPHSQRTLYSRPGRLGARNH